jgi:hypothetical protein
MIRRKGLIALGRAVPACLALWLVAIACQSAQTHSANSGESGAATTTSAHPTHDLSQDESAGGHTLRKHVAQSDEQLRERLRRERHITAASTWNDRATAESTVALVLEQNRDQIDGWWIRSGGHPNLVLDYNGDTSHPIGRSLRRGADHAEPCAHATVVLKWAAPNDYYVLTSYPECRE